MPGRTHRRYTPDEKAYLREIIPGRSYAEILELANARFDTEVTRANLVAFIKNNRVNTGRTGRFEAGHVPANKGRKGWSPPGTEATRFPKGHIAANNVPIGTEVVKADGYVWVKVQDGCGRFNWKQKHILMWEAANGPLPEGHVLLFANQDRTDVRLDNLVLAERADLAVMNKRGLMGTDPDLMQAGVLTAKLIRRTRSVAESLS